MKHTNVMAMKVSSKAHHILVIYKVKVYNLNCNLKYGYYHFTNQAKEKQYRP